ncbi:50S ribosomal protein L25/general stress protein Ctc [Streptomyces sp. NA04227]|uniref:50S ribosomal protein L25/general stress protein Ctc n=1 Tax=Streptomyces sp. NA04227 TaxID=2742136 RepID=UPI0015907879|nr:50S ribosomal protein L25/general stress protein Ctc [Streptomyces sp. NA04227]QKW07052.1 50S ribosomal protein L25/general stress protein Ctc [Streptomyces sp. NA04227]
MSEVKISAAARTEFGKGAARRIRREDKVPGVLYGHGADPVHLTLPGHELLLALRTPNVLISLDFEGKNELAIPKSVQRDPLKGFLEHVDLLLVKRGEKVGVEIPVQTEGELAPGGNLLEHVLNALPVEAEATHIPESVTVSIEGLTAGASVLAKDITLPSGTTLAVDGDAVVLQVLAAQAEEPAAESAEGEGEGAEASTEA